MKTLKTITYVSNPVAFCSLLCLFHLERHDFRVLREGIIVIKRNFILYSNTKYDVYEVALTPEILVTGLQHTPIK